MLSGTHIQPCLHVKTGLCAKLFNINLMWKIENPIRRTLPYISYQPRLRLPTIMAKIKLFIAVQRYLEAMGFYAPSQPNQICTFNRRNSFHFCVAGGACISAAGYFFFEADSTYEYSNSFYVIITLSSLIIDFTIFLYKRKAHLKLIENYREFIEKRKRWLNYMHRNIFIRDNKTKHNAVMITNG